MKKLIALVLSLVMCVGLVACGSSGGSAADSASPAAAASEASSAVAAAASTETAEAATADGQSFNIGLNNFVLGLQVQDLMQGYSTKIIETMGSNIVTVNDEGSVEKMMQNVQNLISSGVDALIVFVVADNLALSIGQMCEEAQIPFVLNCSAITDEEVKEQVTNMDMFVGLVSDNHARFGQIVAERVLADGCKTAIISAAEYGSYTQDTKVNAFRETFEAGGGTVLAEARTANTADSMSSVTDDLIVSNLDADCFFVANSMVGSAAAENLKKYKNDTDMKLYCTELDSELCEHLRSGILTSTCYASYTDNIFSTILLYNYLIGNPLRDENGKAPYLEEVGTSPVTAEMTELFEKVWFDQCPVNEEYIKTMCDGTLTYDEFVNEVRNFSAEEVFKMRVEDGTLTAEEVEAAGISLD